MSRTGSSIEEKFCEAMKGKLDLNKTYTSNELIALLRDDPDVTFEFVVYWLFGGADWIGDTAKEEYVTTKLNEFIQAYPNPKGQAMEPVMCTSITCRDTFYFYYAHEETPETQDQYKKSLLDVFVS